MSLPISPVWPCLNPVQCSASSRPWADAPNEPTNIGSRISFNLLYVCTYVQLQIKWSICCGQSRRTLWDWTTMGSYGGMMCLVGGDEYSERIHTHTPWSSIEVVVGTLLLIPLNLCAGQIHVYLFIPSFQNMDMDLYLRTRHKLLPLRCSTTSMHKSIFFCVLLQQPCPSYLIPSRPLRQLCQPFKRLICISTNDLFHCHYKTLQLQFAYGKNSNQRTDGEGVQCRINVLRLCQQT